jgi:hypothetical protein
MQEKVGELVVEELEFQRVIVAAGHQHLGAAVAPSRVFHLLSLPLTLQEEKDR